MTAPPVEMAPDAGADLDGLASLAGLAGLEGDAAPFGDPEAPPASAGPQAAPQAPPFAEAGAPKRKHRRKGAHDFGGPEVPPDLRELYTPETVGRAFAGLIDATYRLAGAETLTPDERASVAGAFAYYCQRRAPADLGRFQPELVLGLAILATVPPRMERVVEVTVPWWRKLFGLFRRSKIERAEPGDAEVPPYGL